MRWLRFLLAIALCGLIAGPRSRPLTPIYPETITIRATPVVLDARDPERVRVGSLVLLAGWRFDSPSPQFTGYSGLHVDGDRFTLLSDWGSIVRFRLGRFGHPVGARIDALPTGCGRLDDKDFRDSESLTGDGMQWWVGYETKHRICRVTRDFNQAIGVYLPPAMRRWPRSGGAEAMLRLSDGRFLVFAERALKSDGNWPLLVFAGNPVSPATKVVQRRYRPPFGYAPTDAAELPDGRVLIVNRDFSPVPPTFRTILTIVDPSTLGTTAPVEGQVIARLEPPVINDNFEGVAVTREGEQVIVWLVSDDNSMSWQRTYLLKFALDPDAGRAKPAALRRPEPTPLRSSASTAGP